MRTSKKLPKKPTMLDVAKRAGVSISSVSRVTNNYPGVHPQLRAQVESALKDLNYLPSLDKRRLQHPRTRIIYFLLANRDLNIPFHSRVLQSIEKECSRQVDVLLFRTLGYTPQMAPEDLKIPQLLQLPLSDKKRGFPDGVILTGITSPNLRQALKDAGLPVLLLGNNYSGTDLEGDAVTFDGFQGAFDATRHLIDLGHTNILYIGDPKLSWFSNLYEGYLHALREPGLKPVTQNKELSDSFYSNGYLSVDLMFQESTEITAIFAGYDDTALGAWKALDDRKLQVPRDVSLVGFDDEDYAAFTVPPLTTVRIDVETVGRELINQLYRKMQNPSVTLPVVRLSTTLVKRGTCWPVKSAK